MNRVAIIGSGIAGLGTAWFLRRHRDITVFEGDARPGGHAHTVDVPEGERTVPIDTGFMVFNPVTYPRLVRLFRALDVPETGTDMSFSVQHRGRGVEYSGSSLNHLFAQRRNLLRPSHYRMLWAVNRFNRDAATAVDDPRLRAETLGDFVRRGGYGEDFMRLYLVPMASAVWSTPPERILRFPASTLVRFFHNHGFLGMHTQHAWRTVVGGSRRYVERLCAPLGGALRLGEPALRVHRRPGGVEVVTRNGAHPFDQVVLACHPPAALGLLGAGATAEERRLLGAFSYQPNPTLLHTDPSVMPATRLAWSSWNYRYDPVAGGEQAREAVSTHYWMNRLQGVSRGRNYFVSLNAQGIVDDGRVLMRLDYEHPLFDRDAVEAQAGMARLNGAAAGGTRTYFAGAWQGYGFHEDGLASAERVAALVLGRDPWEDAA